MQVLCSAMGSSSMGGILCTPPFLSELLFPPLCLGLLGMTQETKLRASAGGGGCT